MPCNPLKCQCGQPFLPQRYVMVILVCLALLINFVQRENFGIIIGHFGVNPLVISNITKTACGGIIKDEHTHRLNEWQYLAQALLFGSYIIGYVIMMLPSGYIADKYGARKIFITSFFISSLVSGLFPFMVKNGFFWLVCTGRAILGASSACLVTSSATLVSRWIPKPEQATVCAAIFTSTPSSMILVHVNYIKEGHGVDWEIIFYCWGGIGVIWCVFGSIWLFSSPDTHPSMTFREKTYLDENLKQRFDLPLDWIAILLDPAVWALVAAQIGHAYIFYSVVTNITTYYIYALNLSLQNNMIIMLAPHIGDWIFAILTGYLADFLVYYRGVKPIILRKVYYGIGTLIPGIFVIIIVYLECKKIPVFVLVAIAIVLSALFYCSVLPNVLEITYNYPGFVVGVMHMFASVIITLSPFSFMYIASNDNSFESFRVIAFVIGVMAIINTVLYSLLGSSKRRLWDMTQAEKEFYNEQRMKDEAEKAKAAAAAAAAAAAGAPVPPKK